MNENFIFNPKHKTIDISSQEFYCLDEHKDFTDDDGYYRAFKEDSNTLARKITKENNTIYQIKISSNKQLFNPFSKFDREKSYSFLDNVVRPTDKFINVNQTVFDYYLRFINTQNTAWLNKAERERV
jgi:hypothetical protein